MTNPEQPEYASVEAYVEYLMDEEREEWTAEELSELSAATRTSSLKLVKALRGYGLRPAPRESERRIRGFTANPHDRWSACPMHAGSAWEQIAGFAATPEH